MFFLFRIFYAMASKVPRREREREKLARVIAVPGACSNISAKQIVSSRRQ